MKIKNTFKIGLLIFLISFCFTGKVNAEITDINLTIRSGPTIIFSGLIPLPIAGTVDLNSHSLMQIAYFQ